MARWWRRVGRKWRTLWGLAGRERTLLLQAHLLLPAIVLLLRVAGFRRSYALLKRWQRSRLQPGERESERYAARTATLVYAAAGNVPVPSTCLSRSLTLWHLLRRQGVAADLRIGVRRADGAFQAHAWVEVGGAVLNDDASVHHRFSAFDALGAESL